MDEVDIKSYSVMSFVDFAQKFSFNASYLQPQNYYQGLMINAQDLMERA